MKLRVINLDGNQILKYLKIYFANSKSDNLKMKNIYEAKQNMEKSSHVILYRITSIPIVCKFMLHDLYHHCNSIF